LLLMRFGSFHALKRSGAESSAIIAQVNHR